MAIDVQRTRPLMSNPTGRAVDRLFDETFAPFYGGREGDAGTQSLPVTIWETDDGFYAAFLAPGLEEDSINVTVQEETLSVAGELKLQSPVGARMIWQEFGPRQFRRFLRFGTSIDRDRVEATYKNGLLMLTIPKAEKAKPHQIRVKAE